jgi:hypothetical protein
LWDTSRSCKAFCGEGDAESAYHQVAVVSSKSGWHNLDRNPVNISGMSLIII